MGEYLCDDPLSAAAAMIGVLATFATPRPGAEKAILVIEVTEGDEPRFRVWTTTVSVSSEKGEKP